MKNLIILACAGILLGANPTALQRARVTSKVGSRAEAMQEPAAGTEVLAAFFDPRRTDAPESLGRRIAKLGEAAPGLVIRALSDGRIESETGRTLAVEGRVHASLLAAARILGRERIMPLVVKAFSDEQERDRYWMLSVVGHLGLSRDAALILRVFGELDAEDPGRERWVTALEAALSSIHDRDSRTLELLGHRYAISTTELRFLFARVVGKSRSPRRIVWLADRLHLDSEADLALLAELARPTSRVEPLLSELHGRRLTRSLFDEDFQILREAARANGQLQNSDALPRLIELLSHESGMLAAEAHRALIEITGLCFSADPLRWQSWHALESAWYEDEAPALLRRLDDMNEGVVARTLGTLSGHRYQRHELASRITPLLNDYRPATRLRACRALARLGSLPTASELVHTLEDTDPRVVHAGLESLKQITGRDLPPVAALWEAALLGEDLPGREADRT